MATNPTVIVEDIIVTSHLRSIPTRYQLRNQVAQLRAQVDYHVSSDYSVDSTIISSAVEVDQSSATSVTPTEVFVPDVIVNTPQSTQPVVSKISPENTPSVSPPVEISSPAPAAQSSLLIDKPADKRVLFLPAGRQPIFRPQPKLSLKKKTRQSTKIVATESSAQDEANKLSIQADLLRPFIDEASTNRILGMTESDKLVISKQDAESLLHRYLRAWGHSALSGCRRTLEKLSDFLQSKGHPTSPLNVSSALITVFLVAYDEEAKARAQKRNEKNANKPSKRNKNSSGESVAPAMLASLKFARDHLCLKIDLAGQALGALIVSAPSRPRTPATPISIKMLIHVEYIAANSNNVFAAYFAAAYAIAILASLRVTDCQRSRVLSVTKEFIHGESFQAKDVKHRKKGGMSWWCPVNGLSAHAWLPAFERFHKELFKPAEPCGQNFLFRSMVIPRNGSVFQSTKWGIGKMSNAQVIFHVRKMLQMHPLCLSAEEADLITNHSARHFHPESSRALGRPLEVRNEIGRWKGAGIPQGKARAPAVSLMANLYSQSSQGTRYISIVNGLLNDINKTRSGKSDEEFFESLPNFGGFDLLCKHFGTTPPPAIPFDDDSDEEDDGPLPSATSPCPKTKPAGKKRAKRVKRATRAKRLKRTKRAKREKRVRQTSEKHKRENKKNTLRGKNKNGMKKRA